MRKGRVVQAGLFFGVWVKLDGPLSVAYRGLLSSDARLGHLARLYSGHR